MLISNLSLLVEENGLDIVARAERVIAVVHQLVGRGVNAVATGKDLHTRLSSPEDEVSRQGVDDLPLSVDSSLQLPLANGLVLGSVRVLQHNILAIWGGLVNGHVALGGALEGLTGGRLSLHNSHCLCNHRST
ncbi:hypothetical protein WR25_11715 [Diploscapter pachys]|uniref:Uncharacterized protein n=1 Tax=Diploscapter pachys TaxID=2018661 RepID=A0A2A2KPH8_9BILA|nr:hypothetical protein WR25_11715 [Diploscapter pachys]